MSRAETCSTLGSNVNTPLPSNKISCVRKEHTLPSNWFIEHNGDDEPYDQATQIVEIFHILQLVFIYQKTL